jgi:alpha-tubulin suppressor-like RCC1 family protein/PKD repeat protein
LNGNGQLGDGTTEDRHTPVQVSGLATVTVTAVAAGDAHSMALTADNTVWTWGVNDNGQLGDGTTTERDAPGQLSGLTGITAIAAGAHHSLALKSNGTIWGWGLNDNGQLGDGTTTERETPVQVSGLTGVIIAIAAGEKHSLALMGDGTVWAWGNNDNGQLGDGTLAERHAPVKVASLAAITAIAAGNLHSLALTGDGAVWSWGDNEFGQLGDGTTDDRSTPVSVSSLSGIVTAIAGGDSYTFVLKASGTAWMWGNNGNGQLGDGSTTDRYTPLPVYGLSEVTAIAGKGYHALALVPFRILTTQLPFGVTGTPSTQSLTTSTGTLPYSWSRSAGTLPAGLTLNSSTGVISGTPAETGTFTFTVMAIDANGETAQRQFSLVVYSPLAITTTSLQTSVSHAGYSQTLTAIGGLAPFTWSITAGSLPAGLTLDAASGAITGVPTLAGISTITVTVTDALSVAASQQFSVTIYDPVSIAATALPPGIIGAPYNWTVATTGGVPPYTWGLVSGTLPPGLSLDTTSGVISGKPSTVGNYTFTIHVTNGDVTNPVKTISIKIVTSSYAYTWGDNYYYGTMANPTTPVQVAGLPGVTAVSGGDSDFTTVLKWDGTVWNWGFNHFNQLGDGTMADRQTPVQVAGLSGITAIAGGYWRAFAVKSNGTVVGWGSNGYGQLGDGSTSGRSTPTEVSGLSGVTAVSAGYLHTVALKADGTVWSWGDNEFGQLGDGTSTNRLTSVQVAVDAVMVLSGVTAVSAGQMHSMALMSDGTVWTWGYNANGQLGDNTTVDRHRPAQVPGLSDVTAIAADFDVSIALKSDGTVWNWGNNIGAVPVKVAGLSGITAIAGGNHPESKHYAVALKSDSTVWKWGKACAPPAPTKVAGLAGVTAIAGGDAALVLMPLGILTEKLAYGFVGTQYSQAITALSGSTPYTWSVTAGSLPPGLTLNGATGEIAGMPATAGNFTFTAQVRDAAGSIVSTQLVVAVMDIATSTLPPGANGVPYNQTLSAIGGTAPYSWSISAGTLPPGLSINKVGGIISGTPTTTGSSSFTVQVADTSGIKTAKAFSIVVYRPPVAAFTGTPLTGQAPLFVTFTDSSGNDPVTWSWSFGDSSTGSQQNPMHVYSMPGTYTVALTAANPAGSGTVTRIDYITVEACINAPVRISGIDYSNPQNAYLQAANTDIIELQAQNFANDLVLDRDIVLTLRGGYDCGYADNPAAAGMLGTLRVTNGTVKVEKLRFI